MSANVGCGCGISEEKDSQGSVCESNHPSISKKERAMGALMGLFIGEALGTGFRWYYDIDEKINEYGPWVSDYVASKPDNWHGDLKTGDVSQTGQMTMMLMESVIAHNGYNEQDYADRLDEMFKTLGGAIDARGRVTERVIRHVIKQRRTGVEWKDAGSLAVGADAAIRAVTLSARYHYDPQLLAKKAHQNIRLTHIEPLVSAQSLAFVLTVCGLINAVPMSQMRGALLQWAKNEDGLLPTFTDAMLQPTFCWSASQNPAIRIEPAWNICQLYGLACQIDFLAPASYYLVSRFPNEFEMPVLSALNGGGNNMARASMTGAMAGAMVGLKGIPIRFIEGLQDKDQILEMADKVTDQAEEEEACNE